MSPNFNDITGARSAIISYLNRSSRVLATEWSREPTDSELPFTSLKLTSGIISFQCGFKNYRHDLVSGNELSDADIAEVDKRIAEKDSRQRVKPSLLSSDAETDLLRSLANYYESKVSPTKRHQLLPRFERDLDTKKGATPQEVLSVLLGAGEVYTIKAATTAVTGVWQDLRTASRFTRAKEATKFIIAAVSGFAIGAYFGYSENPECSEAPLKDQLNEKVLWQEVGNYLRYSHTFQVEREANLHAIVKIRGLAPDSITLRDFYNALESAEVGQDERLITKSAFDQLAANSAHSDPLEYLPVGLSLVHETLKLWGPEWYRRNSFVQAFDNAHDEALFLWRKRADGLWEPNQLWKYRHMKN